MATYKSLPMLSFATRSAWTTWLRKHHRTQDGIWLKFAKKAAGIRSVSYEEAREGAIIYGWIDGLRNACDDTHYLIRFTPRRARSKWSKINRGIAEALIKAKRMKLPGLEEVRAAKADGRWAAAYALQAAVTESADFTAALAKAAKGKKFYATISKAIRRDLLRYVDDAKKPETRKRRIAKLVAMLKRGEVPRPGG